MALRPLFLALSIAAVASAAHANPALVGTWNGVAEGERFTVTFDARGGGDFNGRPIRYMVQGNLLAVEDQGTVHAYQYQVQGNQLAVVGGPFQGVVTLTRGSAGAGNASKAAAARSGGTMQELVGRWCKMSSFSANGGGGSQSSACFELRADGTYVYGSERSMSAYAPGVYGGTSSSSNDAGRWSATPTSITAQSQNGSVSTYQLERRNHPKNRDPMLCLDGECYVTAWRRAPW